MPGLIVNDTEDINPSGGDIVLAEPAGLATNELLLASLLNSAASSTAIPANITGFTSDATNSSATGAGRTTHRVADGSEGPTYTSTVGASTLYTIGKLLRIVGIDSTTPIDAVSTVVTGTASSFALPEVTNPAANCLAIALVGTAVANNTAIPTGWFLYDRYDVDGSAVYYRYMGAADSTTGTPTVTLAASGLYIATVITLKPATVSDINLVRVAGMIQTETSQTATAVDMPNAADIAVGSYLIARIAGDNNGSAGVASLSSTVTDPRSNTWTMLTLANQDPGAAAAGTTCGIAYCKVANAYTDGDDITVNWSPSTAAKAIVIEEWTGIHATTPVAAAAQTRATSGTAPDIPAGGGTIVPTATGQLVYVALATEGPQSDAFTGDTDTTNGAWIGLPRIGTANVTASANQTTAGQFKLVTGTTGQHWDPTITSRDFAAVIVVFDKAPAIVDIPAHRNIKVAPSVAVHQSYNW